ncbi:MAG: hypothetical protein JWO76_629 [Nocardioides sp.]|nr:hypothetical protein [Nocardioides sp.]
MTSERDLDAPTPPGGPQRTDAPAGSETPGEPGKDPGPSAQRVTRPEGEGDVPSPAHDRDDQTDGDRDLQEENAETSLDQPSS